jgi:hypothetical protein
MGNRVAHVTVDLRGEQALNPCVDHGKSVAQKQTGRTATWSRRSRFCFPSNHKVERSIEA